jgi:hypothetical protein
MKMPDQRSTGSFDSVQSADELRRSLLDEQNKKAEADLRKHAAQEKELLAFADDFLRNHVTDEEIARVRRVVAAAVKDGKLEAMVYSFPSTLCTDHGRAINNNDKDWPTTLQGKAKEFYERYEGIGRPAGYKLKVMIINFPGGIPGDVGMFLNWEPEDY